MENNTGIEALLDGKVPQTDELLQRITVGLDTLTDFLDSHYLREYIPSGGSKIKFISGRAGSGKSHLQQLLLLSAKAGGYLTASFSAREIWMHDFREIYLEVLRQCDIDVVLTGCAHQIIKEMGYDPQDIENGKKFIDYLSEKGEADVISRNEIRGMLRKYFTKNPLLDNNFACCCSLLTGDILGHPVLEASGRDILKAFLYGDKTVKLSQLRALGLAPSRITKYNARYFLRSLAEAAHLGGFAGIMIDIDNMEVLAERNSSGVIHYTKLRREDTYESIRQLIDDIDQMNYIIFFLGFDRELIENENYGMKSYQALWMRIQNEVVSARFNRFSDIIDLDRFGDEFYSEEVLRQMSERLADVFREYGVNAQSIDADDVKEIEERSKFGRLGLPYMINRAVLEKGAVNG